MTRLALTAALVVALVGAGCGITDVQPARDRPISPIAVAQARHQYPSRPASREHVAGAFASPSAAIAAFARAYINWTADTVASDMTALAAWSIGQARAATQLASAQTATDYELRRDGIANSGTVEAIAPLPGRLSEYLVVTREQTTATGTSAYQGLQPAWHVTIAMVTQVKTGEWVLSGWEPQS